MKREELDITGMEILIVDDTPENIDVLRKAIESQGLKISFALDGQAALELVKDCMPDLILLDIMMPKMDGFETCRRLKDNPDTYDIPVIFLSAKTETDDVVKGFKLGALDYITKPFKHDEVCARVQTHLQLVLAHKYLISTQRQLEAKNKHLLKMNDLKNTFIGMAMRDLQNPEKFNEIIKKLSDYHEESQTAFNVEN